METTNKYDIISRNLAEVVDPENKIISILNYGKQLKIYWGTATTGKPHFGYLVPLIKIKDFLLTGSHVTILFADIHAILDNLKSTSNLIEHRTTYYEFIIKAILKHIFNVNGLNFENYENNLKFVKGSSFQTSDKYIMDLYKLMSVTPCNVAQKAGAEVVKQSKNPLLSSVIYPLLQALDEEYLDVDVQFGGVDQRKIFMYARENLEKIGYRKCSYLMNPLIPGLTKSGKMSSSEPPSKIDYEDSDESITNKLLSAFSIDGKVENNGLISIIKYIIFEFYKNGFIVNREEKYGGNIHYLSYSQFEQDFIENKICSIDLKPCISKLIIEIISPIRNLINNNNHLLQLAYPN